LLKSLFSKKGSSNTLGNGRCELRLAVVQGAEATNARDYSLKTVRDKEREWLGLAESDYRRFVSAWKEKPPAGRPGAAKEVRRS